MKRVSILALSIVLVSFLIKYNTEFDLNKINHDFVKVKTDFYVCKYEVSNFVSSSNKCNTGNIPLRGVV